MQWWPCPTLLIRIPMVLVTLNLVSTSTISCDPCVALWRTPRIQEYLVMHKFALIIRSTMQTFGILCHSQLKRISALCHHDTLMFIMHSELL
ncbi:hypothetical protein V8C86DRAFT_2845955 [Haematococcus lacustris]